MDMPFIDLGLTDGIVSKLESNLNKIQNEDNIKQLVPGLGNGIVADIMAIIEEIFWNKIFISKLIMIWSSSFSILNHEWGVN